MTEVLHELSFMKLSTINGANVCELVFVLEINVLSTWFKFRSM